MADHQLSIVEQVTEGRRYHNWEVSLLKQIAPGADGTVQGTKLAVFKRRLLHEPYLRYLQGSSRFDASMG
jgi:hypothetical protein